MLHSDNSFLLDKTRDKMNLEQLPSLTRSVGLGQAENGRGLVRPGRDPN